MIIFSDSDHVMFIKKKHEHSDGFSRWASKAILLKKE